MKSVALDAHLAAAQGLAGDNPVVGRDAALAGETEVTLEMSFRGGARSEKFRAASDFDEAFLALALFAAGGGHTDAERLGIIEEGGPRWRLAMQVIEMELNRHSGQSTHGHGKSTCGGAVCHHD